LFSAADESALSSADLVVAATGMAERRWIGK
jgi:hypothetical protein